MATLAVCDQLDGGMVVEGRDGLDQPDRDVAGVDHPRQTIGRDSVNNPGFTGTFFSLRPTWPKPSQQSMAECCPTPVSAAGRCPAWTATRHFHQGGRWDTTVGRVRRAGAMALRLGEVLHPGRVAGPGAHFWRPQSVSTGKAGRVAGGHGGRHRRGGRQLHHALHSGRGHHGANRCHLSSAARAVPSTGAPALTSVTPSLFEPDAPLVSAQVSLRTAAPDTRSYSGRRAPG